MGGEPNQTTVEILGRSLLVQWLVSVCVQTHATAVPNIFPPFLREVLNFRPHIGYSGSLQYVISCPFALLIILISLITECLSFGNCPTPWKVSARMRLTSRV